MEHRKRGLTFQHGRRATRFSVDLENEYKNYRKTLPADCSGNRNYSLTSYDLEIAAIRDVYIPTDGEKRRALKRTMLNSTVAANMTTEDIKNRNNYIDALVFVMAVFLIGFSSTVSQFALKMDPGGPKFNFRMPYAIQSLLSVLLSAIGCFIWHDWKDLRDVFDPVGWVENMPIVLSCVIGEEVGLNLQQKVDPALLKVISQTKLLVTVIAAKLICQQSVSKTQWLAMIAVTGSILMYVGFNPPKPKSLDESNTEDSSWLAVLMIISFICTVCTVIGGIITERLVKRNQRPLLVIIGRNQLTGFITTLAILAIELPFNGQWDLIPFGGFHRGVWLMIVVDLIGCWFIIILVNRLNSIFKNLAVSLAMLITYVSSCTILPESFNPPKFDFSCLTTVSAIAVLGIAYASSRQDSVTIYELERDMRNLDFTIPNSSEEEDRQGNSSIEDGRAGEPTSESSADDSLSSSSSAISSEPEIRSDVSSNDFVEFGRR